MSLRHDWLSGTGVSQSMIKYVSYYEIYTVLRLLRKSQRKPLCAHKHKYTGMILYTACRVMRLTVMSDCDLGMEDPAVAVESSVLGPRYTETRLSGWHPPTHPL